jgi:hypothetical protein
LKTLISPPKTSNPPQARISTHCPRACTRSVPRFTHEDPHYTP